MVTSTSCPAHTSMGDVKLNVEDTFHQDDAYMNIVPDNNTDNNVSTVLDDNTDHHSDNASDQEFQPDNIATVIEDKEQNQSCRAKGTQWSDQSHDASAPMTTHVEAVTAPVVHSAWAEGDVAGQLC